MSRAPGHAAGALAASVIVISLLAACSAVAVLCAAKAYPSVSRKKAIALTNP